MLPGSCKVNQMDRFYLDKVCEATTFSVLVINIGGWIAALVKSWAGGWEGNVFPSVWICILGGILAAQAYYTYKKPQLTTAAPYRCWLWICYAIWMFACAVILIIGYAVVPQPTSSAVNPVGWWAFTWFPVLALMAIYTSSYRHEANLAALAAATSTPAKPAQGHAKQADRPPANAEAAEAGGVLANSTDPAVAAGTPETAEAKTAAVGPDNVTVEAEAVQLGSWRKLWRRYKHLRQQAASLLGWSSIFWALFMTLFLVIQAAWQAADHNHYTSDKYTSADAYATTVAVPIDQTDYTASLYIRCVGPTTPGKATFVLEADRGSPAATLFGLQDELAKLGRRSCSYDRLGLGWSDDIILPAHLKRIPFTLRSLLSAAGVARPYVMVGHGWGGQLVLQYASMYPEQVVGLALLDSFSDAAAHLTAGVIANATDKYWGTQKYEFVHSYPQQQLSRLGFIRAMAPFGWPRFAGRQRSQYKYTGLVNALTGSNKHFQGQWGEYSALVQALPDSLDEQLLLAAPNGSSFWYGYGWKNFGPMPVLVLPAAASVAEAGCDLTQQACQQSVLAEDKLADPKLYYPQLVLAYTATLSSNANMTVLQGDHSFPWEHAPASAAALAEKFSLV